MTWTEQTSNGKAVWGLDNGNDSAPEVALVHNADGGFWWEIWCCRSSNMIEHGAADTLEAAKRAVEGAITQGESTS